MDPDLPQTVHGDSGKLCTLVRKLLENAVKFTDSGHVLLSAELEPVSGGVGQLLLRVVDTGRGIPEDKRQTMYRAFTQGDDSPTRAFGGMGLGLSLAKALSDLLKAQLLFNPVCSGGSEFILRIKLPAGHAPAFPQLACAPRPVGILGRVQAREELERWAPRLGIRLVDVTNCHADKALDTACCGAVIADEESWSKTDEAYRTALLGGDGRRLVMLGGPYSREYVADRLGPVRLQYPPSLATFALAVQRALDPDREPMTSACPVAPCGATLASSPPDSFTMRDYQGLFDAALCEASSKGLSGELAAAVEQIGSVSRDGDWETMERLAKRFHDGFADGGAVACAKLALAVSIDTRNGGGSNVAKELETIFRRRA